MRHTRRDFLRTAWKIGGLLLGGTASWTTYEALRPFTGGASVGRIRVGDVSRFEADSARYFPTGRLYVVNARGQLFALSQRCPHLGCRVPFCESSGRFECPCHGSVFDIAGEWVSGPSPRGMDRFHLELDGHAVIVDTGDLTSGPDRGAEEFREPARGPSCLDQA